MLAFPAKGDAGSMFQSIMGGIITLMSLHRKDVKQTPGLNVTTKSVTIKLPGMLENNTFASEFLNWMSTPTGGRRGKHHAEQIVSKILKFFAFCLEDMGPEEELESSYVDYCIGSAEHIRKFLENMETAHKITNSGQLGYIRAILELTHYRKFQGLPTNILQHFSVVGEELEKAFKKNESAMEHITRPRNIREERPLGHNETTPTSNSISSGKT